ncbi:hypothetical protein AB0C07_31940, partial [Actinoplanes missouriensis]|uniref:hypothetical protein n=1 Tax=Actinoplanes missouriensis TaxID=1866 RepID=UPI0033D7D91F
TPSRRMSPSRPSRHLGRRGRRPSGNGPCGGPAGAVGSAADATATDPVVAATGVDAVVTATAVDAVVAATGVDRVPEQFRSFAEPRRDPVLVAAYRSWLDQPSSRRPVPHAHRAGDDPAPPRFTPLSDPEGLAARIQYLL